LTATVFERDCGATTDYSTIVSLGTPTDGIRDDRFIIFIAKGRKDVSVKWAGPKSLYVECDGCSRDAIFKQVITVGGIDVHYSLPAVKSATVGLPVVTRAI
jgi:hypothetical protein